MGIDEYETNFRIPCPRTPGWRISHRLDGPVLIFKRAFKPVWAREGMIHRIDGDDGSNHKMPSDDPLVKEPKFYRVTLKLGSINQFVDFVARCDILLL